MSSKSIMVNLALVFGRAKHAALILCGITTANKFVVAVDLAHIERAQGTPWAGKSSKGVLKSDEHVNTGSYGMVDAGEYTDPVTGQRRRLWYSLKVCSAPAGAPAPVLSDEVPSTL
jgi:hypothetical protein